MRDRQLDELRQQRNGYYRQIRRAERVEELNDRYDPRTVNAILNEEIFIGMAGDAVRESRGKPDDVNRTITENRVHEQWVYEGGDFDADYVYVENGEATAIQN